MAVDFLADAARAQPDAPALDDGVRGWSYRELGQRVGAAAQRLRGAVASGSTVALVSEPTGSAVMAVHAVLAAGAVLAPLNPRSTRDELRRALEVLEPGLVLVAPESWERASSAGALPVPLAALDGEGEEALRSGHAHAGGPALPAETRVLMWTSGTGGSPRGVALTDTNLRAGISAAAARLALGPSDRWLASLGLAHVGGLLLTLRAAATGALLMTRGRFRPDEATALVDVGAVTHASLVPTMLRQFLDLRADRPAASLRCLLVGGAQCPRALVERAVGAGIPLALTYGMTESTSQAATAPPALVRRKAGTVGPPLEGVEVRLDEGGELMLRGPTVAAGYVGTEIPLQGPGGWLCTGDLAEIDGEGHLWITGRRLDRIVTGGVNVDPVEVEDVLRCHAGVADVVVVGLPDERWGEVVAAVVVRADGANLDSGELEGLTGARLTTAKVPRRWLFLRELPRNANGQVDRDAARFVFGKA